MENNIEKKAKEVLITYSPVSRDHELKTDLWPDSTVLMAMVEFAKQERVSCLEDVAKVIEENLLKLEILSKDPLASNTKCLKLLYAEDILTDILKQLKNK